MPERRVITWVLLTVAGVIGAVIVYLSIADLGWLRPRIEAAVARTTGRKFEIDGKFTLRALWTPSFVIENAHLANADWGSAATMLQIGHLSGRVNLWSLLSGPVRIEALRVADVDLLIESNSQGGSNLDFPQGGAAEAEPAESDRKSTRLNSSHRSLSRMPSSA